MGELVQRCCLARPDGRRLLPLLEGIYVSLHKATTACKRGVAHGAWGEGAIWGSECMTGEGEAGGVKQKAGDGWGVGRGRGETFEHWRALSSSVVSCCTTLSKNRFQKNQADNLLIRQAAHLIVLQCLLRLPSRLRVSQASPLGQVLLPMQGGFLCNQPLHQQGVWVNAIHQITKLVVAAIMASLDEVAQQLRLQLKDSGLWQPLGSPERLLCIK